MKFNKIIRCKDIHKSYATLNALSKIEIEIEQGESVAIIGANGAGKTTLFNIMLGLLRPTTGYCEICGVQSSMITPKIRENIGFVADHASPIPWATTSDIAKLYSSLYKKWNKKLFLENMEAWGVDAYRRMNQLSKGQKRLAEIALITATNPEVLILDEPFNGLDAVMRITIQRLLKKLQNENKMTIVYATHIITELPSIADRMIVLRYGEKLFDKKLSAFNESPEEVFVHLYREELIGK